MKVIFMGTPAFAIPTLEALIGSAHEVVAVYTQPPRPAGRGYQLQPSPVHQLAEQHRIPVYHPKTLKSTEEQACFAALGADIAVVAAYGLILPDAILHGTQHGCINVHPSALPRWRGAAPIQRTIMAGDATTDMCIMQMDAGLDTGAVLMRQPVAIAERWDAGALHDHMAALGAALILQTLAQWPKLTPQPQSAAGVTYAHKITKDEARIDWQKPAQQIHNQIRGLSPYPAAYFIHQGEKIKILSAHFDAPNPAYQPAGLLLGDTPLRIVAGDGGLIYPLELQREGKKRMGLADFLNGFTYDDATILE